MNRREQNACLIERQLGFLMTESIPAGEAIDRISSVLPEMRQATRLKSAYAETGKLSEAMSASGLYKGEPEFLSMMQFAEEQGHTGTLGFSQYLSDLTQLRDWLALLKTRVITGLGYAIWLTVIAAVIMGVYEIYILPSFAEMFQETNTNLPDLTQFALSWSESAFRPFLVAVIFLVLLILFWISMTVISRESKTLPRWLIRIPTFSRVGKLTDSYKKLTMLKTLLGFDIDDRSAIIWLAVNSGRDESLHDLFVDLDRDSVKGLEAAQKTGTLSQEVDHQLSTLTTEGESEVIRSARYTNLVILAVIVAFIIFMLLSMYLPIFQLGTIA